MADLPPAQIGLVTDVAVDAAGDVFFADNSNNRIAKIDARSGLISTIAGNGTGGVFGRKGNWGDGGPATSAIVNAPWGIGFDSAGNLYITDPQNNVVRKVTMSTGIITTVAGDPNGGSGLDGNLAVNTVLSQPLDVAVDSNGDIFIAEGKGNIIQEVVAQTGIIKTIAGTGVQGYSGDGGPAVNAQLGTPTSLAVDAEDNVYFADYNNYVVRKVTVSTGIITTVAGSGTAEYSGENGPATSAGLGWPEFLNVDTQGNLYIGDYADCLVRKVNASNGVISTIAGTAPQPSSLSHCGYDGDGGPATEALMMQNFGVATDSNGNLYIADTKNFRIRLVSSGVAPSGVVYVTVSSSDREPAMEEVVTLEASVVDAQNAPVTTGTVSFYNGNSALGESNVDSNGVATIAITLGPGGDQLITAEFANSKSANTGNLALHVSGFSVGSNPASLATPKGQTAALIVNMAAFYGFTGTVDLSCAGMPAPGSCLLSSNSVTLTNGTPSAKVTLTLTTATTTTSRAETALPNGLTLAVIFPFFLFGVSKKRARRALLVAIFTMGAAFVGTGLTGCGGSGAKNVAATGLTTTYVPAGTYTVMLTATSGRLATQLPITVTLN